MTVWNVPIGSGVWHVGDTFDVMRTLPSASVDMIATDPPYGTTGCSWDSVLPLAEMWAEYWRLLKPNGAIVMTAAQPFTSVLLTSQIARYKHSWIWDKATISNPMQAKHQPLRQHEDVLVFSNGKVPYFPQKTDLHVTSKWKQYGQNSDAATPGRLGATGETQGKYPKTILRFPAAKLVGRTVHPTQKPVALFEYLIRTYTNPDDTVLDNTAGSGTTAVAAEQSGRRWICIERDEEYSLKAMARLAPYG